MDSPNNETPPHRPRAVAEIAAWLRLILPADPASVFEIRALDCLPPGFRQPRNFGGYFSVSNIDAAADAAAHLTRACRAKGVYFTINPVLPDLLSRRANRVEAFGQREPTTTDSEILSRRWMLIDCDPIRPAGVSSSDSEHNLARDKSHAIRDHLTSQGWPLPLEADSGNGFHLLYCIDVPTTDGGLIQRCLQALAARFTCPQVDVDKSVFNPARICKLYGTFSRKGDSTDQRPHRRSCITQGPQDGFGVVSIDLLEKLASEAPAAPQRRGGGSGSSRAPQTAGDRIRAWLQKRGPSVAGQHGHDDAWFTACTLVRGFNLSIDDAFPLLQEWNQTCQPPWSDSELMHKLTQAEEKANGESGYMLTGHGMPSAASLDVSGVTIAEFTGDATSTPETATATMSKSANSHPGNRDGPRPSHHKITLIDQSIAPPSICSQSSIWSEFSGD